MTQQYKQHDIKIATPESNKGSDEVQTLKSKMIEMGLRITEQDHTINRLRKDVIKMRDSINAIAQRINDR